MEKAQDYKNFVSLSHSTKPHGAYHRHFYQTEISSLEHLAELMQHKTWSPILWKDGLRLKQNFLYANLIALDFDDGKLTIKACAELLIEHGFSFILGTSKSHQKEKKTDSGLVLPPCDRFRLVIPTEAPTTSLEVYEYTMREMMNLFPCDISCKDGARFFFASPEIRFVNHGKKTSWREIPDELKKENRNKRQEEIFKKHREESTLPDWAAKILQYGAAPGGRHVICYRLGATLYRLGYTEEQIIGLVMKSPLSEIGQHDVERAIANGAERAARESSEWSS